MCKLAACTAPATPVNATSNSDMTICAGESATLSVNGTGNVSWHDTPATNTVISNASSFITPALAPGTYSYFAAFNNTCSSSMVPAMLVVTVNPAPQVNITTESILICGGLTVTLTAEGADSYTWNNASTGASLAVSPTVTSIYSVTGYNAYSCAGASSITIHVFDCSGISGVQTSSGRYTVSPNPAHHLLDITATGVPEMQTAEIYNATGALVLSSPVGSAVNTVSLQNLPAGIYIVVLSENNKIVSRHKIIKE